MLSGISIWQLLIILLIVVVLFGTKKLRGMGTDLGSAVKGFRQAVREGEKQDDEQENAQLREGTTIDQEDGKGQEGEADNRSQRERNQS